MNVPFFSRLMALVMLSIVGSLFVSCATTSTTSGKTQSLDQLPGKVQKGVTNQATVRTLFGAPKRREIHPAGERWHYGSSAQQRTVGGAVGDQLLSTGIGMIPYAGGAINGLRSVARVGRGAKPGATIDFDQKGIVQDYLLVGY